MINQPRKSVARHRLLFVSHHVCLRGRGRLETRAQKRPPAPRMGALVTKMFGSLSMFKSCWLLSSPFRNEQSKELQQENTISSFQRKVLIFPAAMLHNSVPFLEEGKFSKVLKIGYEPQIVTVGDDCVAEL